jgi:ABC-2 type transport system permease protein
MALSSITLLFMAPAIVAMGLGLGAAYPDFTSENPAQSVTGFGGLVFMLISTAFIGIIIALEAGPAYALLMSGLKGRTLTALDWIWIGGSFAADMVIAVLVIRYSFKFGENRLRVHLPLQPEKQFATKRRKNG